MALRSEVRATMSASTRRALLLGLVLVAVFVLQLASIRPKALTYDEPMHHFYAERVLAGDAWRAFRSDNSKMPVSAVNVAFGRLLTHEAVAGPVGRVPLLGSFLAPFLTDPIKAGRIPTMFVGLLLLVAVYRWSRELYGPAAGVLSLALAALSPTLLAHARLVTTDVWATCAVAWSSYLLWRLVKHGRAVDGMGGALAFGLGLLAKYSCAFLGFLFPALLALRYLRGRLGRPTDGGARPPWHAPLLRFAGYGLVYALFAVVLINAGFRFNGAFAPLDRYEFRSASFAAIQRSLSFASALPLPLAQPYLDGMDYCTFDEQRGPDCNVYLLGEIRYGNRVEREGDFEGFRAYFPVAFGVKVPLGTQLLLALALGVFLLQIRRRQFWNDELFLLGPMAFFAFYFIFLFTTQLGIRYALVAFPFVWVFIGSLVREPAAMPLWRRWAVVLLTLWAGVSTLSYTPHFLSYFNELVLDRKQGWHVLADSNLDWLQNRPYLEAYAVAHPDILFNPTEPVAGHIVVDANFLVNVFATGDRTAWLRENFEPEDHIAHAYLVYRVGEDELRAVLAHP
jgi:4-amino-4-deoxy-L-arabinose transferase-like glycosyltransferase